MAEIDAYVNRHRVGRLTKSAAKHFFSYDLDAQEAVSLTMPMRTESYLYEQGLHPIFQMNLPEGALRLAIERATAKQFGSDDLTLLSLLGNHQIGRLRYALADKTLPAETRAAPQLNDLLHSEDTALFSQLMARYAMASGVAGVQPKVLLDAFDDLPLITAHDIKLSSFKKVTLPLKKYIVKTWGPEFPELACNEFVCLSFAQHAKLITPRFYLSDNTKLLISERFDVGSADEALGFEDFCVLQGKPTAAKYDASIESCANTLRLFVSPEHVQQALYDFFKLTLINVKIQNGDAHLKNYGIIYRNLAEFKSGALPSESRQFSPVYDVVSTTPYIPNDSMALTLTGSKRWPKWQVLEKFGKQHCGLTSKKIEQSVHEIEASAKLTLPIIEKLIQQQPAFEPVGEKIAELMMRN
ncbi:MAG TPA: type II toxin-antitoxin system HipA family toxin [Cellvibrionaceae bacterium]